MLKLKKLIALICTFCVVMAMASCFATSGEQGFIYALEDEVTADNMWGAVTPLVGIIGFVFVFAFAYRIIRKVLKKGSQGKFGM